VTSRTLVWRGLDEPRLEVARVSIDGKTLRANGTQVGARPRPYELRYTLEPAHVSLEVVGERTLALGLPHWADFFDLGYSPVFNSLPVLENGVDEIRDYVMAWVSVPDLEVRRSDQRYEPVRPGVVRYRGSHRPATPYFDLELDDDGLVLLYPTLAERVE
jgi:hypothetical protein